MRENVLSNENIGDSLIRCRPLILAIAWRMLKNYADAEDVYQETALKAIVSLHSFEGKAAFSSWVTGIAINVCLMRIRRARTLASHSPQKFLGEEVILEQLLISTLPSPEDELLSGEKRAAVRREVCRLRKPLREAIEDHFFREMSVVEIAKARSLPQGTVKIRLHRGRKWLYQYLSEH